MRIKSVFYVILLIGSILTLFVSGKKATIKTFPKIAISAEFDKIVTTELSGGTVTDIDGNVYHTVKIGTQEWMIENLKTTKYRNGAPIPNVTIDASWAALSTGAYCWYGNDATKKASYGALYNWYAVADSRNIAPVGWHVPTDNEWNTLTTYLGGERVAGGKLKETGTSHWLTPNTGATNSSGFKAKPGGYRVYSNGTFRNVGHYGDWWSITAVDATLASGRGLGYNYTDVDNHYYYFKSGFSVRCVRDQLF